MPGLRLHAQMFCLMHSLNISILKAPQVVSVTMQQNLGTTGLKDSICLNNMKYGQKLLVEVLLNIGRHDGLCFLSF
jgi:hypothetical protein